MTARSGGYYDGDALVIAKTVAEMSRFGLEPRHLRAFRAAADREVGLVEQVVAPLVRQRNPEARGRAEEVARELAALSVKLHASLVKAGLRPQPHRPGRAECALVDQVGAGSTAGADLIAVAGDAGLARARQQLAGGAGAHVGRVDLELPAATGNGAY